MPAICSAYGAFSILASHTISSLISPSELSLTVRFQLRSEESPFANEPDVEFVGPSQGKHPGLAPLGLPTLRPPPNNGFLPLPQETVGSLSTFVAHSYKKLLPPWPQVLESDFGSYD